MSSSVPARLSSSNDTNSIPPSIDHRDDGPAIAVDPALNTGSSGESEYDEEEDEYIMGDTFSITSSVYNYRYENGRSYHRFKEGAYLLPNDESERDRLDLAHHLSLTMLGGELFTAPIENPRRVLDVGTGTGIWAIAFADTYPDADVVGTDLSPIQPSSVPPNCRFEIDDAESEWTYPVDHFDFIHSRMLFLSIRNWEAYIARLYKHTASGGYVQIVEHDWEPRSDDGSYHTGLDLWRYIDIMELVGTRIGLDFQINKHLGRLLKNAGFVDVSVTTRHLPWNPYPADPKLKTLGYYSLATFQTTGFEAYGIALLTRHGGMTSDEAKELCEGAMRDTCSKRVHVYNTHFWFSARKPLAT